MTKSSKKKGLPYLLLTHLHLIYLYIL